MIRAVIAAVALASKGMLEPSFPSIDSMGPPQERRMPASHSGGRGPLWKRPNPPGSGQTISPFDDDKEIQRKLRRKRGF